ncbi:MAG: hypothetical protein ABUJ98_14750 [Hyphomicrobium sp.]
MHTDKFKPEPLRPPNELTHLREENARLREALTGLMEIAEISMPDTFFHSDSRVSLARRALGIKLGEPS